MTIRRSYPVSKAWLFLLTLVLVTACKDPFAPNLAFKETNFLVVEGYINVGTEVVTTLRLSRTVPVDETLTEPLLEEGAVVLIEDNLNNVYPLTELGDGIYVSDTITLPVDRDYRIHISTNGENEFASEFVTPLQTPAIDSVTWTRGGNGIDIKVATHDPQGVTQYYQWDYEEIWELRSPYFTFYRFNLNTSTLEPRPDSEIQAMRKCWKRATPPDLKTVSLEALNTNSVSFKLINIPVFNERLSENYTVLVRQHALDQAAYNYLQIMSKNTNEVGTFFDPQPSQLTGNIAARNSNDPVIGYIGAYTTSEHRIYIENEEVPDWGFNLGCSQISLLAHPDTLGKYFASGMLTPLTYNDLRTEVYAAWMNCADCRRRGGDNDEPSFWDDVF